MIFLQGMPVRTGLGLLADEEAAQLPPQERGDEEEARTVGKAAEDYTGEGGGFAAGRRRGRRGFIGVHCGGKWLLQCSAIRSIRSMINLSAFGSFGFFVGLAISVNQKKHT